MQTRRCLVGSLNVEPSGVGRNPKKQGQVSSNVKDPLGGVNPVCLDQLMDSPENPSPNEPSDLSNTREDDPNQELFKLTDTAYNRRTFGGFSQRVESIKEDQPSTSTPENEDMTDSNQSFESDEKKLSHDEGKTSVVLLRVDSADQSSKQRGSSLDHVSPNLIPHKPLVNGARSEMFSPDQPLLIKPRSIIRTSKFASPQILINPIVAPEDIMVKVDKSDKLPMSLFEDPDDNKFLAVRKWKQEMLSAEGSPKSARSKHSAMKSVKFKLTSEEESNIKLKEKDRVRKLKERISPKSMDKTVDRKSVV